MSLFTRLPMGHGCRRAHEPPEEYKQLRQEVLERDAEQTGDTELDLVELMERTERKMRRRNR